MSALVVDSSSWVSYFAGRGPASLIDEALEVGRVHLPPIVAAELLSGNLSATARTKLQSLLSDLPLCAADLPHWFRVGALRSDLRSKGLQVSTPDAHVAQCAMDLEAGLLTEDRIFERISAAHPLRLIAPQR